MDEAKLHPTDHPHVDIYLDALEMKSLTDTDTSCRGRAMRATGYSARRNAGRRSILLYSFYNGFLPECGMNAGRFTQINKLLSRMVKREFENEHNLRH